MLCQTGPLAQALEGTADGQMWLSQSPYQTLAVSESSGLGSGSGRDWS